jgi:protein involved in polysaccharide export with SLBB domain
MKIFSLILFAAAALLLRASAQTTSQPAAQPAEQPAGQPQVSNALPAPAPISAAPSGAAALAPWQQKLTLGPGDVIDVSIYSQADSQRGGIVIGPDGRINYLQATDVTATGLTIDELRAKLEAALQPFHRMPRVVIVPTGFHSKKYFILGNVMQRGAFTLDRPTTLLEAVAKAHGFMSSAQRGTFSLLSDLSHAFLVRKQQDGEFAREPVDFEGLFVRGELQHNLHLQPDDYLYFPPQDLQEIYVLGEVRGPGVISFVTDLTVLGAIAMKGGFTETSYRQKVLVIRGSLDKPETFVIDVSETLRAVAPDFRLQARGIVYVSRQPWAKAEQLLKAASSDFVRAATVSWTGRQIGVPIK